MKDSVKMPAFTLIELLISLVLAAITINLGHNLLQNSCPQRKITAEHGAAIEAEYRFSMVQADVTEAVSLPSVEGRQSTTLN